MKFSITSDMFEFTIHFKKKTRSIKIVSQNCKQFNVELEFHMAPDDINTELSSSSSITPIALNLKVTTTL